MQKLPMQKVQQQEVELLKMQVQHAGVLSMVEAGAGEHGII